MLGKISVALSLIACFSILCAGISPAADAPRPIGYPERPIEIIVPYAPGGATDKKVRLLARYLEKELNQAVLVKNVTKGGNIKGLLEGMNAPPDGYVWCAWAPGLVTDDLIIRNVSYTYEDVLPVCMIDRDAHVIVVNAAFAKKYGIASLGDLVERVRENPGRFVFGVGGNWTFHDFLRLKLEIVAGAKFVRMPFLGGEPALQAALAGNCDVSSPLVPEFQPKRKDARIVPLAVTQARRLPWAPKVPTVREAGYPELEQSIWRVLTVPKGTPPAIANYIESVVKKTMETQEYRAEAELLGLTPTFMGSKELAVFLREQREYFIEKTAEWGIRINR